MSGRSPSDNPRIRGPRDRNRIALEEPYEVQAWCAHFGCTETELRETVRQVGHMAAKVARHFRKPLP